MLGQQKVWAMDKLKETVLLPEGLRPQEPETVQMEREVGKQSRPGDTG